MRKQHTRRYTKTGKYKKEYFWNRNRKTWFEIMCLAVIAIWGGVAADLHPVAEAFYSIPEKHVLYNMNFREPLKINQDTDDVEGNTGETAGYATPTTSPVSEVEAVSESATSGEGQTPVKVQSPSSIEAKILKAWEGTGNGRVALDVFKCESGYKTDTVGDTHLAFEYNGQRYGRSIGVAQIRTGGIERNGRIWVASNNVAEFEEKMKNPDENLKMARVKYDASVKANGNGWHPWTNCAKKVGAL